jgi:hypothetical protein
MNNPAPVINRSQAWPALITAIVLALFYLVVYYVYGPLKNRRKHTVSVRRDSRPVEIPDLPRGISMAFYTVSPVLAEHGFEALGHISSHLANTKQDVYLSVWLNRTTGDAALIFGVRSPTVFGPVGHTSVGFRTEFPDGSSIETSNVRTMSVFPKDPTTNSLLVPDIWDIALLHRLHRAHVEDNRAGKTPTLEHFQNPAEWLQRQHADTYEPMVRSGYYALDLTGENFVPTIKGAFLFTYKALAPFRPILKFLHNRETNQTLRNLNFGGTKALLRKQSSPPRTSTGEGGAPNRQSPPSAINTTEK